jgi:galactose mutarotase-like enzyme
MTSVQLSSSFIDVTINSLGAEICSVKNKSGFEYIWQADKNIWPRHAPVLFPIVGKLKDNYFVYENKRFELTQHGFARDMQFELMSSFTDRCTFQLISSVETDMKYPFDFVFTISYEVKDSTIITKYQVKNLFARDMYFSVGAHPGFNCFEGSKFEDHYLEFETESLTHTKLQEGLISESTKTLDIPGKKLNLSTSLFDNDALVFENNQVNKISLSSNTSENKIVMECKGWPYFGIWSKKDCDKFVCLEPWYGVTDKITSNRTLPDKKGIIHIPASGDFGCTFSMSFL